MTSGTINFNEPRNEIVSDALSMIRAYGVGETPSLSDIELGARTLNRMIKAWQADGIHLWKKSVALLFMRYAPATNYYIDSATYLLGNITGVSGATTTYCTENYSLTDLTTAAAVGATNLVVTSSAIALASYYIGISLDDGTIQWTTIVSAPDSTHFNITAPLTGAAAIGKKIFTFQTLMDKPLQILGVRRVENFTAIENSSSIRWIPMLETSYEGYNDLPNKFSQGYPTIYNYNPNNKYGILRVWPVPSNVQDIILELSYTKMIENFDTFSDYPDFPNEWLETIVICLAVKLSPHFGKSNGQTYTALVQDAQVSLEKLRRFDNEMTSIYIRPDRRGWR